jgi:hypothetical protein
VSKYFLLAKGEKGVYMTSWSVPRQAAIVAACLGISAAAGAAPAMASGPGENIFASGSSLQKIAQQNIWTGIWHTTATDHPTLTNDPTATYTSSSSGGGLAEFGNTTGTFDPTQDVNADNGSTNGYGRPVLDALVGSDDPPTGPLTTPGTNLANASLAATGSATTPIDEITVPVAQAPVAILVSLPTGIVAGAGSQLRLKDNILRMVWDNNVTKTADYAANTWGAWLEHAGWHKVAGSPGAQQFTDDGSATGGKQAITRQVRSSASGTSYTYKGFLHLTGDPNYTPAFVVDDDTWPVPTTNTGNAGGGNLVADTTANPGSTGYANLADAATASPAYTNTAQTTSTGGTHQILYALIQDNWVGSSSTAARFADPQSTTPGFPNVYTGNNININGASPNAVGFWNVPFSSGTTFDPTGSWGGTQASDPDVFDHGAQQRYPIVAATYDLGWSKYSEAHSNTVTMYGGTATQAAEAGRTANSYLRYEALASQGQADLARAHLYYARLPSTIDTFASTAVSHVAP